MCMHLFHVPTDKKVNSEVVRVGEQPIIPQGKKDDKLHISTWVKVLNYVCQCAASSIMMDNDH